MFTAGGLGAMALGLGAWSALLGGASSIGSSLMGANASKEAAEIQSAEARRQFDEQMAWEREKFKRQVDLLNTAHQREVDDLIAAGLNPVLSATGGNGAGSAVSSGSPHPTASASMPEYGAMFSMMERGLNSAAEGILKSADVYSRAALNESEAAKNLAVAAQTKEITQPMKDNLLQQVKVNSSLATKHAAEANQIDAVTPAQVAKLAEEANLAATNNAYLRRKLPYAEAEARSRLASASAQRAFQNGVINNMRARTIFEGARTAGDLLNPFKRSLKSGGGFRRGFPSGGNSNSALEGDVMWNYLPSNNNISF